MSVLSSPVIGFLLTSRQRISSFTKPSSDDDGHNLAADRHLMVPRISTHHIILAARAVVG